MAANLLPIIALGAAAFLLMKKNGNGSTGSTGDTCPEGEIQVGTKRDGTIVCGPKVTYRPVPDAPIVPGFSVATHTPEPEGPEDPYEGQPWTNWPQPVLSNLSQYTCPIGYVLAYRGVLPGDKVGGCGDEDFVGETWCVPPWGAVPWCSWKECEHGLTVVQVVDGNQLRKVCRNIPSS